MRAKVLLLCLLICIWFTGTALASKFYEEGDKGPDVILIQKQLAILGYSVGAIDGHFGPNTTAAVKAYQEECGLVPDGVVGPATYVILMERGLTAVSRDSTPAKRVIQFSLRFLGVPYRYGGVSASGFDCSGFTRHVFRVAGIELPRMADEQFELGRPIKYSSLQPGDMVFFTTYLPGPSHCGIYIGNGRFISATSSRGIAIDPMDNSYWAPRYIGARRIL